jgi:Na+-driven multidrug efflux pump
VLGAVDFHALGQVIWVSLVASVGVTVLYSLAIFGFGKATEARRSGNELAAVGYGTLAVVALIVFAAAVVIGVLVMLHKD